MGKSELIQFLKENIKVEVIVKTSSTECSYNEKTYVQLEIAGEVISESEIEGLTIDK